MLKTTLIATGLAVGLLTAVFDPSTLWNGGELLAEKTQQTAFEKTSTEDLVGLRKKELQTKAEKLGTLKQRIYDEEGLVELARAEIHSAQEKLAAEEDVLVHARLKLSSTGDAILVGSRQYSRATVEQDVSARLKSCESLRTRIDRAEKQFEGRNSELEELRARAHKEETSLELAFQDLEAMKARALNAEALSAFRREIDTLLASTVSGQASAADRELQRRIRDYERQLDAEERQPLIDWSEGPVDLPSRLEAYFEQYVQPKSVASAAAPPSQTSLSE